MRDSVDLDQRSGIWAVERYWPGVTAELLVDARDRLRRAATTLTTAGRPVRYLGSTLMPVDEFVLCLFEAQTDDDVRAVNELAAVPFDRIGPAVRIGVGPQM